MHRTALVVLLSTLLVATAPGQQTQQSSGKADNAAGDASAPAAADQDASIQRGEYLVMHVAMCVQCHSPRDRQGELIQTELLNGAPIPLPSPYPNGQWGMRAPKIAGLPGWERRDAIQLLQTGEDTHGWSPRPPMPPFRMTAEDARAVVDFLKSLN